MSVDRITNTLIIDRFNINYEARMMFDSHWLFSSLVNSLFLLVFHASRLEILPITTLFRHRARSRLFSPQLCAHTLCIFILQYIIIYGNHYYNIVGNKYDRLFAEYTVYICISRMLPLLILDSFYRVRKSTVVCST